MGTCLKLTGIVTMLMGLQLLNLAAVSAKPQSIVPHKIESQGSLTSIAAPKSFGKISNKPSDDDYEPPDNKGPRRSQGTGRRLR